MRQNIDAGRYKQAAPGTERPGKMAQQDATPEDLLRRTDQHQQRRQDPGGNIGFAGVEPGDLLALERQKAGHHCTDLEEQPEQHAGDGAYQQIAWGDAPPLRRHSFYPDRQRNQDRCSNPHECPEIDCPDCERNHPEEECHSQGEQKT